MRRKAQSAAASGSAEVEAGDQKAASSSSAAALAAAAATPAVSAITAPPVTIVSSAKDSARKSLLRARKQRVFDALTELIPGIAYDVSSLVTQYDAESLIALVDRKNRLTVASLDERDMSEPIQLPFAIGESVANRILACPPLPGSQAAYLFVFGDAMTLYRQSNPVSAPLQFELVEATSDDVEPVCACAISNSRLLLGISAV